MRSTMVDLKGPVHLAEWGEGKVRFVLVHGLGGSNLNWMAVGPRLAKRGRVVAPDLAGFGQTPLAGRRASVAHNRALLHRVVRSVADAPVILVGNSMGGLIALLETAVHPEEVAGLVLVDSAVPLPLRSRFSPLALSMLASSAIPGLGVSSMRRLRRRLGSEGMVRRTLALCSADMSTISPEVVDAHIHLSRERGALPEHDRAFISAARSIVTTLYRRRRLARLIRAITVPTLLIHGDRDRLIPIRAAHELARQRPDWELRKLQDVGHIPQMEVPDRFMKILDDWIERNGLIQEGVQDRISVPPATLT